MLAEIGLCQLAPDQKQSVMHDSMNFVILWGLLKKVLHSFWSCLVHTDLTLGAIILWHLLWGWLGFERKCEGKFFHTVMVTYLLACHAAVNVSIPRRFHFPWFLVWMFFYTSPEDFCASWTQLMTPCNEEKIYVLKHLKQSTAEYCFQ